MLLYFAISETAGSSRADTADFIAQEQWFAKADEDNKPYPHAGHTEARWRTMVAFGRKDAYEAGHLFHHYNYWELNREGVKEFRRVLEHFRSGNGKVCEGYLWTPKFKLLLDPSYVASPADKRRPLSIYKDELLLRLLDLL